MELTKFPRTPHLIWLNWAPPRDDKVMSFTEQGEFFSGQLPVVVQEKVDGANVGISCDEDGKPLTQSRGDYFGPCVFRKSHPQFNPLWAWIAEREESIRRVLGADRILFGEWCFAQHSIYYDALPDWFIAFDIYDRRQAMFLAWDECQTLFTTMRVEQVPELARITVIDNGRRIGCNQPNRDLLLDIMDRPSSIRTGGPMEGIYLRVCHVGITAARAKIVRQEFTQAIDEHWTKGPLVKNALADQTRKVVG